MVRPLHYQITPLVQCTGVLITSELPMLSFSAGGRGKSPVNIIMKVMKANTSKTTWRKRQLHLYVFLYSEKVFNSPNPLPLFSQSITSVGENSRLN